jgi:hypothetical protein
MEVMAVVDGNARNEIAKILLQSGADVTARDRHNNSALDLAVCYGFGDTVALLLASGAELNTGPPAAATPLGRAIQRGNVGMMARLLAAGARVDAAAIRLAAEYRNTGHTNTSAVMLQLFVHHGVDLTMVDEGGTPVLEYLRSIPGFENIVGRVK